MNVNNKIITDKDVEALPLLRLKLWPNRSLNKKFFYRLILIIFIGMIIPIIPFIGSKTAFVILPFSLVTLLLLAISFLLNYKSGELYENITIWPNLIELKRYESNGTSKEWNANPYWTKVNLYKEGQKIQNYLTLTGSGREVEVGAFLAPNERLEIKQKIDQVIKEIN